MNELIRAIGRWPLAGMLIALVPTLTLWKPNLNRLGYEHALPTLAFVVGVAVAVTCVLYLLVRSWPRAGLLAGLISFFIFYSVPIAGIFASGRFELAGIAILFVVTVLVALKILRGEDALSTNGKLNLLALAFTIFAAAPVVVREFSLESSRPDPAKAFASFQGHASADSPDVWHVLFDRYASEGTLADRYAFDNRPFLDELRKRGFEVGENLYSNYQRTGHSVAATLNGASLDQLASVSKHDDTDWLPIYRSIADNRASAFFSGQGYRTIYAGTWWSPTREINAGETVNYRALPELGRKLLNQTAIGVLMREMHLPYGDGREEQCDREKIKFDRLEQIAREGGRKYVFAHFLLPHPPFVFAADGRCRSLDEAKASSRRDNYVQQVEYANARALRLIDAILAGPRPAVIVIHSDEGPWPEPYVGNEHTLGGDPVAVEWTRMDPVRLREKMGILLAIRSPDGPPRTVPTSPVQIYPAILADHFESRSPVPPSTHEVFESDRRLYTFHDVAPVLGSPQAE